MVNFLCAVDYRKRLRYISFGFGSAHNARIYRNSTLRTYLNGISNFNFHAVGDAAFRGFDGVSTPNPRINFDNELEKQRVTVENAFFPIKRKFKRFTNAIVGGEKTRLIKLFLSACFINNFIIDN